MKAVFAVGIVRFSWQQKDFLGYGSGRVETNGLAQSRSAQEPDTNFNEVLRSGDSPAKAGSGRPDTKTSATLSAFLKLQSKLFLAPKLRP